MSRILREGHVAGIRNQPFFFLGCPGETLNQAQETVKFLFEHKYLINSATLGTFLMERDPPTHRFHRNFKVNKLLKGQTLPLILIMKSPKA